MVLSIVKCSHYNKHSRSTCYGNIQKINSSIEIIGPVVGPNISAMRNLGASTAKGQWVLFIDDDCVFNENSYKKILELIQTFKNYDAVSGVYSSKSSSIISQAYSRIQRLWVINGLSPEKSKGIRSARNLLGGALLVKKAAWKRVNGFDEEIGWGGEESHFILKMKRMGFKTGVTYKFRVIHNKELNIRGLLKRAWFQNFNRAYYFIKQEEGKANIKKDHLRILLKPRFILPTVLFFVVAKIGYRIGLFCRWMQLRERLFIQCM